MIQQEADDLCSCIALGGASKRPDKALHEALQRASRILFALDFDDAGKEAYRFWKQTYPQLRPWPVPIAKSPGDAFKAGMDLRQWIHLGLKDFQNATDVG